jgi:hypothetical protein
MSLDYPWIAEYSLYRRAPLHTSKVCARKSQQDCSMVSSSLQCTHWGFTASMSIAPLHTSKVCAKKWLQDCSIVSSSLQRTHWGFTASVSTAPTQKPPLVPYGFSHHSLTEHPSGLPSQLPHTAGWYAKTRLYHILRQAVPIYTHGCTVFMGGRSMNQSIDLGMITSHWLPASHQTKPWTVGIAPTSSIPVTPNPIIHTNRIKITIIVTRVA